MSGIIDELKYNFLKGTSLIRIIFINVGVYLLTKLIFLLYYLTGNGESFSLIHWMAVPTYIPSLILRPWTLITYMFYHEDFLHILFNMLWLFWFGKIFLEYFDGKKLTSNYILGGLCGAFLFILAYNFIPVFENVLPVAIALGASAAVMAIVFSVSVYAPNYRIRLLFFGEVKLIYIALISVVIDLIMIPDGNAGGHIAHLGGALFGYLWATQYRHGKDISSWFGKFLSALQNLFKRRQRLKVAHKTPANDLEYNKQKVHNQKEVDRILDKISKGGYESLSKAEKETLFKMGNKN